MNEEIIKQDINLLEFPLYVINSKSNKNTFEIKTNRGLYTYKAAQDDVPDSVDALLLYCLLHKVQKEEGHKISISKYELVKKAGLNLGKRSYERIEKSLYRWLNVSIKFEGNFYENKNYVNKGFHILSYEIDKKEKKIKVNFNDDFLTIIRQSKFFKYVNLSYYKALKKPLSKRLYEYLLKQFIKENSFSINLKTLSEKITLAALYPSEAERKIKPALKEINNFINEYQISFRIYKNYEGDHIAEFLKTTAEDVKEKKNMFSLPQSLLKFLPEKQRINSVLKLISKYINNGATEEFISSNILYSLKRFKTNFYIYFKKALFKDYAYDERELAIKEREFAEKQKKLLEEESRIAIEREKLEKEKKSKEQERIYLIVSKLPESDRKKIESLVEEYIRRFHVLPTVTEADKMEYTAIAYNKLGYDRSSNS